tara:strand:+ start:438025 stop:438231 length:207 start_codon:yes stop_codon:yes gene_type:complete
MTLCGYCLKNSGIVVKGRECCELRQLVMAPPHVQREHANGMDDEQKKELRVKFKQMREHLQGLKEQKL